MFTSTFTNNVVSDFFKAFGEFFESEYAKDHTLLFVVILIVAVFIGALLMFLYMKYIYYKTTVNRYIELKKKEKEKSETITKLEKENEHLKDIVRNQHEKMTKLEEDNRRMAGESEFKQEFNDHLHYSQNSEIGEDLAEYFNNLAKK